MTQNDAPDQVDGLDSRPPSPGPHAPLPNPKKMVAVALEERRRRTEDGRVAPGAPKVTAAGRGHIAEQILEVAFSKGIKVREDADLAELLSAVELEDDIPIEAFAAVAEILIYLYRANGDDALEGETPGSIARAWAEQGTTNPAYAGTTANARRPDQDGSPPS